MKKVLFIALLFIVFYPQLINAFNIIADTDEGRIILHSDYRVLAQGESIKLTLQSPAILTATVLFKGREYIFVPTEKSSTYMLIMGLGLDIEPDDYKLLIHIVFPNGKHKHFSVKLPVTQKQFPLKKINVDHKFISPTTEMQERIKKELKMVNAVYKICTPRWLGTGNFTIPSKGKILDNFGDRRIFNDGFHSRHRGIDIICGAGKPVMASNSGRVVLTDNLYYAGNTVIIDHGIGLFSIYCHLSKIIVKKGQSITKGKIIGHIGSTGRVTGPHLHWGFKLHDQYVDPSSILYLSFD